MQDLYNQSIEARFDHLLNVLKSDRFLKKQGLNNEIPFFIFPYKPQEHVAIDRMGWNLIKQLGNLGVSVLRINLYDLAIELLQEKGLWEQLLKSESSFSKQELKEDLQGLLNPEQHMIPAIARKMSAAQFDILFISGVGEVFPYIRSHTILNNLQSTAKEKPTLLWFPGKYTFTQEGGSSLDLFGLLHDDKYYRAFNILEFQV